MSFRTIQRTLLIAAAMIGVAGSAGAQTPTAEGDSIKNVATVTYTDGGTGSYDAKDSVVVKIGFRAGVLVTADETQRPASPSTDNTYSFLIKNLGNGRDTVSASFTVGTGLTITKWAIRTTEYTTLAAFQAALANVQLQRDGSPTGGDTVTVTITYDVATGRGGTSATIVPEITSLRSTRASYGGTVQSDTVTLTVEPAAVAVTPDNGAVTENPGTRTVTFDVQNVASDTVTYSLSTSLGGVGFITISSVTGTGVSGGEVLLTAGQTVTITVEYTVSGAGTYDAGDDATITLTATSVDNTADISDTGMFTVTLRRPQIAITKVAQFADGTPIDADTTVKPGDVIHYVVTVQNTGNDMAVDVEVSDVLSTLLTFDIALLTDATTPSVIVDTPPAAPYNDAWDLSSTAVAAGVTTVVGKLPKLAISGSRTFTIITTVK